MRRSVVPNMYARITALDLLKVCVIHGARVDYPHDIRCTRSWQIFQEDWVLGQLRMATLVSHCFRPAPWSGGRDGIRPPVPSICPPAIPPMLYRPHESSHAAHARLDRVQQPGQPWLPPWRHVTSRESDHRGFRTFSCADRLSQVDDNTSITAVSVFR